MQRSVALRRLYWHSFADGLVIVWPLISTLLLAKMLLGAIVGLVEGWGIGSGIYFAFITGLTIGYGDLVPHHLSTRVIAVALGFLGVILTGLVAALAVKAFQVLPNALRQSQVS
jgi:hypothetical protein